MLNCIAIAYAMDGFVNIMIVGYIKVFYLNGSYT